MASAVGTSDEKESSGEFRLTDSIVALTNAQEQHEEVLKRFAAAIHLSVHMKKGSGEMSRFKEIFRS